MLAVEVHSRFWSLGTFTANKICHIICDVLSNPKFPELSWKAILTVSCSLSGSLSFSTTPFLAVLVPAVHDAFLHHFLKEAPTCAHFCPLTVAWFLVADLKVQNWTNDWVLLLSCLDLLCWRSRQCLHSHIATSPTGLQQLTTFPFLNDRSSLPKGLLHYLGDMPHCSSVHYHLLMQVCRTHIYCRQVKNPPLVCWRWVWLWSSCTVLQRIVYENREYRDGHGICLWPLWNPWNWSTCDLLALAMLLLGCFSLGLSWCLAPSACRRPVAVFLSVHLRTWCHLST